MAKKFVRGVTGVDDIEKFDKTLTNINDLISDGQNTYVHTKKGKKEFYYKVTDGVTSVKSTDSTITVEKSDDGTISLKTNPKKVLEHDNLVSASDYVTIKHDLGTNTSKIETGKLNNDMNELSDKIPETVGTVNLFKGSRDFTGGWFGNSGVYAEDYQGVKIFKKPTSWEGYSQFFEVEAGEEYVFSAYVKSSAKTDSINFYLTHESKQPKASGDLIFKNIKSTDIITIGLTDEYQRIAIKIKITKGGWIMPRLERVEENAYLFFGGYKLEHGITPTDWSPSPDDINVLLDHKQNTLKNNLSIGVNGSGLQQLYALKQTYNVSGGLLKTHVKSVAQNTSVSTAEEEFNFIAKIDKGVPSVNFTLNEHDTSKFTNIITTYGQDNTVRISGFVFTLAGSTLTVSTTNNANQNYVITFSDII